MKKSVMMTICAVTLILAVTAISANAGTLDRGVCISPFFVAGGSANGNPAIAQLKHQMAIEQKIGDIKRMYINVYTTNVYHNAVILCLRENVMFRERKKLWEKRD